MKCVPNLKTAKTSAVVQVMIWHLTGDYYLPEPEITQFTDV